MSHIIGNRCAFLFHTNSGKKFIGLTKEVRITPERLTVLVKEALEFKVKRSSCPKAFDVTDDALVTNVNFSFDLPEGNLKMLRRSSTEELQQITYRFKKEKIVICYSESRIMRVAELISKKR